MTDLKAGERRRHCPNGSRAGGGTQWRGPQETTLPLSPLWLRLYPEHAPWLWSRQETAGPAAVQRRAGVPVYWAHRGGKQCHGLALDTRHGASGAAVCGYAPPVRTAEGDGQRGHRCTVALRRRTQRKCWGWLAVARATDPVLADRLGSRGRPPATRLWAA